MTRDVPNLYLCLVHYPVYNKYGEIVATSVTPLDVHDLGRTGLTYGVSGYYITSPFPSQHGLINEILDHWRLGMGGERQPQRQQALSRAVLKGTIAAAYEDIVALEGKEPFVVATTARWQAATIPANELLQKAGTKPVMLIFGTGYGLTEDIMLAADAVLAPIPGRSGFNHLPVRAAVAIYLDRIYSPYWE